MPVREATALKLDGELTDEVWSRAPKIDGSSSEIRRRAQRPPTQPKRVSRMRRPTPLRCDPRARSRARQNRELPDAPRFILAIRLGGGVDRLLSRQADRIRVLGEPGGSEAGQRYLQRRRRGSGMGRGLGRGRRAQQRRMERRVPHSALTAAFPDVDQADLRPRALATDCTPQRDVDLAAHREEHQRHRLAVRGAARPRARAHPGGSSSSPTPSAICRPSPRTATRSSRA